MVYRSTTAAAVLNSLEPLEPRQLLAAGDLDTTFGRRGILVLPELASGARQIDVLPSGKILLAASDEILRLNPNGSLDKTFGGGDGRITPDASVFHVDFMSDGRILVASSASSSQGTLRRFDWRFDRFKPDGTPDTTLNSTGTATVTVDHYGMDAMAADSDGNIYVASNGFVSLEPGVPNPGGAALYLARVTADGRLDTSFGDNGLAGGAPHYPFGWAFASDVIVLPNGNVEVVGTQSPKGGSNSGISDVFDTTGKRVGGLHSSWPVSYMRNLVLRRDGVPVALGSTDPFTHDYNGFDPLAFAQFNLKTVELDFNPAGADIPRAADSTPGPDNQMYVTGSDSGALGVTRINEDGSIDKNFGFGGVAHVRARRAWQAMAGSAVDTTPDGDVLVAGSISRKRGKSALVLVKFQGDGPRPPDRAPVGALIPDNYVWSGGPITPTAGDPDFGFAVQYTDDDQINPASLSDRDIVVVGPNGYRQIAKFERSPYGLPSPDRQVGGWYTITAPGGTWDPADNGRYQVLVRRRSVFDNHGKAVHAGPIGAFQVNLEATTTRALSRSIPAHPQVHDDVLTSKRRDTHSVFLC